MCGEVARSRSARDFLLTASRQGEKRESGIERLAAIAGRETEAAVGVLREDQGLDRLRASRRDGARKGIDARGSTGGEPRFRSRQRLAAYAEEVQRLDDAARVANVRARVVLEATVRLLAGQEPVQRERRVGNRRRSRRDDVQKIGVGEAAAAGEGEERRDECRAHAIRGFDVER